MPLRFTAVFLSSVLHVLLPSESRNAVPDLPVFWSDNVERGLSPAKCKDRFVCQCAWKINGEASTMEAWQESDPDLCHKIIRLLLALQ